MTVDRGKGCEIDVSSTQGPVRVTLAGDADVGAFDSVRAALAEAHGRAVSGASGEVVVDFSELSFMSSACLKAFLPWLAEIAALEPAVRYRVRIVSNAALAWQRRSLPVLVGLAPVVITLEPRR